MTEDERQAVYLSLKRYIKYLSSRDFRDTLEEVMSADPNSYKKPLKLLRLATHVMRITHTEPCSGYIPAPGPGFWGTPLGQHLKEIRLKCGGPSDLLSVADAAAVVGLTSMRIYQLIAEGELVPDQKKPKILLTRKQVLDWANRRK